MVLALFFTRNVSLELWIKLGLFEREKLIYEEHLRQGNLTKVYWLTYGCNDTKISNKLISEEKLNSKIVVIGMPKIMNIPKIGNYIYSILMPFIYPRILLSADLYKTNQMDGSWSAVLSKLLYRKVLVLRTGYCASQLACSKSANNVKCIWFKVVEKCVYKFCDLAVVSSNHNNDYIKEKYGLDDNETSVLSNYIDLDLFQPNNTVEKVEDRVLYVGRLNKEKNLFNLIEALSQTEYGLDIYGEGVFIANKLRTFALKHNVSVNFFGVLPNDQIALVYSSYYYYVLPSFHEGMPKTLIEAMASGCFCIGTDVPGINEILIDGVNGILSKDTSSRSIYKALIRAFGFKNKHLIIQNSVAMAEQKYDIKSITRAEFMLIEELINGK